MEKYQKTEVLAGPQSGGDVTMTSQEIAELVGSRHDSVKRTIERLAKSDVIQSPPLVEIYNKQSLGPRNKTMAYVFTGKQGKRDSLIVVAQLCPEFTARIVDRWQELEEAASKQIAPTSYIEALEHLIASERQKEKLQLERDEALRTKAQIGNKREATVMARLSVLSRENEVLKEHLGVGSSHKSVKGAGLDTYFLDEKGVKRSTANQLKKIAAEMGASSDIIDIEDPNYGTVKAYPIAVIERFKQETCRH